MRSTSRPAAESTPTTTPAASARRRNASEVQVAAAFGVAGQVDRSQVRDAAVTSARAPLAIDVGLSQLETRPPSAMPGGTLPEDIAPATVPRKNGVTSDENAKCGAEQPLLP